MSRWPERPGMRVECKLCGHSVDGESWQCPKTFADVRIACVPIRRAADPQAAAPRSEEPTRDEDEEDIDTMADGPEKRSAQKRANCRWLAENLPNIRLAARSFGYAVAVHGSLARDVDLLAVPWVEDAATPELLAASIASLVEGQFSRRQTGDVDHNLRPHGRQSWAIVTPKLWGSYIDLSVMSARPAGDERDPEVKS
jgi:hypothetical protein